MSEILKKKSVKIAVAIICLAVLAIIAGFVVQGGRRQQEIASHLEIAQKYISEMDYEQAIAEYEVVLAIDPNNQEAQELLDAARKEKEISDQLAEAREHLDAEEYDLAINICEMVLETSSGGTKGEELLEQIYLEYAQDYFEDEKYDEAVKVLEKGYQTIPMDSFTARISEIKKDEEEAEKKAEEEARREEERKKKEEEEKKRKEWEKPENIYQWMIEQLGIITAFPWYFSLEEEEDFYDYELQFGRDNPRGTFDEYYEILVNKTTKEAEIYRYCIFDWERIPDFPEWIEDWNENCGKKYDLSITETVMTEYLEYCAKRDVFEKYISRVDQYILGNWEEGKKRGFRLITQNLEMPEEGETVWKGEVFYYDGGYGDLSLTVEIDTTNETAKIVGMSLGEELSVVDSLRGLFGIDFSVAQEADGRE